MLSSLLLSLALGWLTNFDGSNCPCVTMQATYEVGFCDDSKDCKDASCKACCQEACKVACEASCKACCEEDCLPTDMVMCGEIIDMPKAQEKAVVVQFRILQTKDGFAAKYAQPVFLQPDEVRTCLAQVSDGQQAKVVSSPTMILCSGQKGEIHVGGFAPTATSTTYHCEDRCVEGLKDLGLVAVPCVSADGRFIKLEINGNVTTCPFGTAVDHVNLSCPNVVLPNGMTFMMKGSSCNPIKPLNPFASPSFGVNACEQPRNVVIMATVRIADDKGCPVATSTACTREMPSCVSATACCEDCSKCDTVESNLAKLQHAAELYRLAEQYERLNQFDVTRNILANVQELCPGSRIALQANEHCNRELRILELIAQSETLRQIQIEWERQWSPNDSGKLVVGTTGEEAEAPTKCSKLEQVLCSYRKACSEGNKDRARQLAIEALTLDPTCFAK